MSSNRRNNKDIMILVFVDVLKIFKLNVLFLNYLITRLEINKEVYNIFVSEYLLGLM